MKRKSTYIKGNVVVDVLRSTTEICMITDLKINGMKANLFDFGTMKDLNPELAPNSGCGNRSFVPKKPIPSAILNKYNLNEDEGKDLINILEKELHIGYCKRCR